MSQSENLIVYPNPVGSELNIIISSKNVETIGVYDMSGKTIYLNQSPYFDSPGRLVVDVSGFNSGVYFLAVQTVSGVLIEKVSVKNTP